MAEYTAKYENEAGVHRHGEFETVEDAKKFLVEQEGAFNLRVLNEDGEILWRSEE